jgi:hypothetical protein
MPTTGIPAAFSCWTTSARSSLKSETISATRALSASRSSITDESANKAASRAGSSSHANVNSGRKKDSSTYAVSQAQDQKTPIPAIKTASWARPVLPAAWLVPPRRLAVL